MIAFTKASSHSKFFGDKQLFKLGTLYVSEGVIEIFDLYNVEGTKFVELLKRHSKGDWGDVDNHDKKINDSAVKHGGRILSSYKVNEKEVWVITEDDRSSTIMITPEEY